jgi:hypothetical protein
MYVIQIQLTAFSQGSLIVFPPESFSRNYKHNFSHLGSGVFVTGNLGCPAFLKGLQITKAAPPPPPSDQMGALK